MLNYPPAFSSARRAQATALFLIVLAGLGGCAQFPSLAPLELMKSVASYETTRTFSAPTTTWPSERWWSGYGDAQLDALIEEALRDAPDMAAASARLRRAEAIAQVAGSPLQPQLGASASATEQKQSYNYLMPRSALPEGWNDYGQAALSFNWELDFWGKNRAGLAAATSQLEASRAELAQARLSLAAAIATDYAELARLFAVRDTAARSVEVRRKTAALFDERFRYGLETRGSLNEAKSRLAVAEGEVLMFDEQIGLQRHRLAALIGAGPDRGLRIERPSIRLESNFALPADLAADLLGRRPDIVAARLQVEAQSSRIEQKKAEFYPNVNLSALIGLQSLGLNLLHDGGSKFGSVGPAVSLPIFTGGRLQGELRGAAASHDEAVANYNRTLAHALQDVANTGLSQKALSAQLQKSHEAVEAASEAHRVARNRYEGGLANYLEVLFAEDLLLGNQRAQAILQSRAFTLDVALQRALGGGYQTTRANTL